MVQSATINQASGAREMSRDLGVEDVDAYDETRSNQYLQNHAEKSSENCVHILRSVTEDAIRDIRDRSRQLEDGIVERKARIMKSVSVNSIKENKTDIQHGTFQSDLFKLLDRRNTVKLQVGSLPLDYKEFMFFDRSSAIHLNHAIKTLGDPSFSVAYSRDYNAIALNPTILGQAGKEVGEFYGPTSIDTDDRNMYVCDSMNCRVVVYCPEKQPIYTIGRKGKGSRDLDRPSSIAVDETGMMFVADSFNDRVSVFTTGGDWKFNVGGRGKLNKPRGVACTRDGSTFVVSDTGNQRIAVYSGSGTYRGNFGKLGMKAGQFVRPQGIQISRDNKVYVTDTWNFRIQIFDIEGKLLGSIGSQGSLPGQFEEPRDISIDTNGNVLVTDTSKHTLQIFNKDGQFVREYGRQGSDLHEFDSPEGVHTDEINRIFVADRKNNRVQIL